MGFKKEPKAYKLKFEGSELDGLEVIAKSLNVGQFMRVTELLQQTDDIKEANANMNEIFKIFVAALISWNLEDEDGKAVPKTVEGIKSQENGFVLEIINAWMNAVAEVNPNLEKKSNLSESMASLPMETL